MGFLSFLSKSKPPKPPDPYKLAAAQEGANINTAVAQQHLQNVNQVTPYGNLTYNQIGSNTVTGSDGKTYEIPRYEAEQSLSAYGNESLDRQQQFGKIYEDAAINQATGLADTIKNPISDAGLYTRQQGINLGTGFGVNRSDVEGDIRGGGTEFDLNRTNIESGIAGVDPGFSTSRADLEQRYGDAGTSQDNITQSIIDRNQPNIDRDRTRLNERLIAMGFDPTGNAAGDAGRNFQMGVNDFNLAAQQAGAQEHSRVNNLISGEHSRLTGINRDRELDIGAEHSRRTGINRDRELDVKAEHSRRAGLKLTEADFSNRQREAGLQERTNLRNQQVAEAQALISGQPIQNPNFVNTPYPQLANTDVAGIHMGSYNAALNRQRIISQEKGQIWGAIGKAGGSYLGRRP